MENGIEYVNPTFSDMRDYYVSPVESKKKYKARFLSLAKHIVNLDSFNNIITFSESNNNPEILLKCKNQTCYVGGWGFRVASLTEKYQDKFIEKYSLKDEFFINNELYKELSYVDRKTTAVIGVHIRRRDYRLWQNGKYYFNDDVYATYMRNIETEIHKKYRKNVFFIVFSDESTRFEDNAKMYVSKNKWYVDHLLMSKCDFLIGPPSTFTIWASYIGKNQLFFIKDNSGVIDISQFKYRK